MRIHSLRLQNFRCFEDRAVEFHPQFNALIGENGAGKSSVLDALALCLDTLVTCFSKGKGKHIEEDDVRRVIRYFGDEPDEQAQYPSRLDVAASWQSGQPLNWSRKKSSPGTAVDADWDARPLLAEAGRLKKAVQDGEPVTLPLIAYYGTGRAWQIPRKNQENQEEAGPPSRLEGYHYAMNTRSAPNQITRWIRREEWIAFQDKRPRERYLMVKEAIAGCMEGGSDIRFDARREAVMVALSASNYVPYESLSDGQRSIFGLVGDLAVRAARLNPHLGARTLQETPGVVLIDELDLHLHPRWQRRIVGDLRRTLPRVQFIATTHSPFLIQAIEPGELIDLQPRQAQQKPEYADQSIEDIAENVMGVDLPQKSLRYREMMEVAEEYYTLLREPGADKQRLAQLEMQMDEKTLPFSDDPAFHALLELERKAQEGSA